MTLEQALATMTPAQRRAYHDSQRDVAARLRSAAALQLFARPDRTPDEKRVLRQFLRRIGARDALMTPRERGLTDE